MNNSEIGLNYEPFVGKDYEQGINGKKVMVLGYYIYGIKLEDNDTDALIKRVDISINHDNKEKDRWINNYRSFIRALTGKNDFSKEIGNEFWNKILFHTYIQEPLKGADSDPNELQLRNAQQPLIFVLKKYQPDVILVWTKKLFDKIEDFLDCQKDGMIRGNDTHITSASGKCISILVLKSFSRSFSPHKWHKIISDFLE